jgi:hypothetical protein
MAPPAAIALALVILLVPPSRDPAAPRLDGLGLALSIVTIGLLIYTIIEAPGRGWTRHRHARAAAAIPPRLLTQSRNSVGAALAGVRQLATSNPHAAQLLTSAAGHAFFDGFQVGCLVAAGVAFTGAVLVVIILPARPTGPAEAELPAAPQAGELSSQGRN